jgi:hypothetical protein
LSDENAGWGAGSRSDSHQIGKIHRIPDEFGYPQAESHKKAHHDLVASVSAFQKDLRSGKAGLSMELMTFSPTG